MRTASEACGAREPRKLFFETLGVTNNRALEDLALDEDALVLIVTVLGLVGGAPGGLCLLVFYYI